ncbi:CU044_5270 family protein [Streptosporangium sp. NBC_01469]|uniref:CU044_5270 family protein n=1 Tax=Streptosporangium sp. NBC_01469 TaxID=2903898 RepID=UPI002E29685C|nr:CU044_5270 family protein [Streptosporangium sp. NBC_01469]
MNELTELERMCAEVAPASPHALALGRNRLLTATRTSTTRTPHRWPRLAVTGALALTMAVGLIAVNVTGETPSQPSAVAAAAVLDRAAEAAEAKPDPTPRDDQFVYVKKAQWSGAPGSTPHAYTDERWESVDGSRAGLRIEHGKRAVIPPPKPGEYHILPIRYTELRALPTDPDELLAHMRKLYTRNLLAKDSDEGVARYLAGLLANPVLPSDLRPAAYRALAKVPGTRVLQDVMDVTDRRGLGIAWEPGSEFGGSEMILILDPHTFAYLGTRHTYVEDVGRDGVAEGDKIVDWAAQLAVGVTDTAGAQP